MKNATRQIPPSITFRLMPEDKVMLQMMAAIATKRTSTRHSMSDVIRLAIFDPNSYIEIKRVYEKVK